MIIESLGCGTYSYTQAIGSDAEVTEWYVAYIKKALLSIPSFDNQKDEDGNNPLLSACKKGNEAVARLLVERGDVNLCDANEGGTPLYCACATYSEESSRLDFIQWLIDRGAAINGFPDWAPLYAACLHGNEAVVRLLIEQGADINHCDREGRAPLYVAYRNRNEAVARLLVDQGADINPCDNEEGQLLYFARDTSSGEVARLDFIQWLIDRGAAINGSRGNEAAARLLKERGVDINFCNEWGCTPLYFACCTSSEVPVRLDFIQWLIDRGAEVNHQECRGMTPLHMACVHGNEAVARLLIEQGADVNFCSRWGGSPLYCACDTSSGEPARLDFIQWLIDQGAQINGSQGWAPLHAACGRGNEAVARLLIEQGADVNLCDNEGLTPLYFAEKRGLESIVQAIKMALQNPEPPQGCL